MSSIAEGYKVIQSQSERQAEEDIGSDMNELPVDLVTAAVEELELSLGERCKRHDINENSLVIQTGKEDTPGIVVKVEGYASQEGVVTASQQEDATRVPEEDMPPVSDIPGYNTTDQVAEVRKYNTEQYMKHSTLNPKKFG